MGCIVLGSVNGDASTVSGCSVLTVGESKAVCVLTAIDPKLTEGDEEGECIETCMEFYVVVQKCTYWF